MLRSHRPGADGRRQLLPGFPFLHEEERQALSAIRAAEPRDVGRVWDLIQELAEYEKLTHTVTGNAELLHEALFGTDSNCRCMVAEAEGAIVGYAISFYTFSTFRAQKGLWLEDLYVTPSHRGHGYGKAMLETLIEEGRRSGFGRIEWSVLDWNRSAIDFYERLGAEVLPDWRICRVSIEP